LKPTAWLVHGFNVRDGGAATTDKLRQPLEALGWNVEEFDYGWTFLLGVWLGNGPRAKKLALQVKHGDVGFGHSNGCAILHRAAHLGAPFKKLVYVNPALDSDARLAARVEMLTVWHSPSDIPVRMASWLPGVAWGDMGSIGCTVASPRIHNQNKETGWSVSSKSHSDVFHGRKWEFFKEHIAMSGGMPSVG